MLKDITLSCNGVQAAYEDEQSQTLYFACLIVL